MPRLTTLGRQNRRILKTSQPIDTSF